ncbi:TPA: DUF1834 family protein [Pasteurella multocida]|uniref:DUF1834 family protein n=1 Tax=Pasteurella multocida TaxID=747 RepID=UPI0029AD90FB|nr:DUF1834 family protein [Pasteurella multocida]MEB4587030.1 DUF1834 family protein [Pasteurella multocida]HEH9717431.1 DUF1834 family protein [Pasteurella multocida]HEH9728674.1 DUF1834 family protein [Pasteurella multocida]HEH9735563.1 DUF1834 family protein [Pasteurella multocida]HEH9767194.1 DUF1834 family protein [Pasteurella multocida]
MITQIENALVERLKKGLGKLANTVKSYGGELDDESIGTARLPAVLVTYGGSRIECKDLRRRRHKSTDTFVIILAVRSLKSNQVARQGGADSREIGVHQLISAVRRLLDAQTLGNLVYPLNPKRVRTIFNNAQFRNEKITAYAVEYEIAYDDIPPLEDGLFPEATLDKTSPDYVFNAYQGTLSEPEPMLEQVVGKIVDPTTNDFVEFNVETQKG